jgi:hypothetical protein
VAVATYNLKRLQELLDAAHNTTVTGKVSSFVGEALLLDLLTHNLQNRQTRQQIRLLTGTPRRDDHQFDPTEQICTHASTRTGSNGSG